MKRVAHPVWLLCVSMAWTLLVHTVAGAGEFRFIASQIAPDRTMWQPSLVLIEPATDLGGGLTFILENPTDHEHVFAVQGLYEVIHQEGKEAPKPGMESDATDYVLKPIRVRVGPKESQRITVSTAELAGHHAVWRHFRFHCPIHKETHLGGSIVVVGDVPDFMA